MKIKLGNRVRDVLTTFEGIVTAKVEYISGCTQFGVTPPAKDGKVLDTAYFDYQRLEVIEGGIELPSTDAGGPGHSLPYQH